MAPNNAPILITAHELTKSFGARPLFKNISFSASAGERVGLIGPNGAGKSTLLRILAGTMSPDEGHLSRKVNLRIGYLAQVPAFAEDATVVEAVRGTRPHEDW